MDKAPTNHTAYIALGSNIEPRRIYLDMAIGALTEVGEIKSVSAIIETAPLGFTDQPDFLNAVLELHTALSPEELWKNLREIERTLGRQVRPRWHEREIDLDVLFYDDLIIATEQLTVPHPEIANREFVLKPLVEIAPNFVHPVLHRTAKALLEQLHFENTTNDRA